MPVGLQINRVESPKAMRLEESATVYARASSISKLLNDKALTKGVRVVCYYTICLRAVGRSGVGAGICHVVNIMGTMQRYCSNVLLSFLIGSAEHVAQVKTLRIKAVKSMTRVGFGPGVIALAL